MRRFLTLLACLLCAAMSFSAFGCVIQDIDPTEKDETYTVNFIVDGETVDIKTSKYNSVVGLPKDPMVEAGYKFEGWYTDDGTYKNEFTAETKITENTVVYAKITRISYTIKFVMDGEEVNTANAYYNGTVKLPTGITVKDGYMIEGWYTDNGTFKNKFTADTKITEKIEVYANITRITYTVKFIVEGKEYTTRTVYKNEMITLPVNPNLGVGYVFKGWYTDVTYENAFAASIKITENTEVYAKMDKYIANPTTDATIETMTDGALVWNTNDYVFKNVPKAFENKPYLLWTINGTNKVEVIRNGWLYVITGEAQDFGAKNSQMVTLDGYNFTLKDISFWNLWTAALKNNFVYEKYVEVGEKFSLGRWTVMIMSDEKLDLYAEEPIEADDKLAVLKPTGSDTVANMAYKSKVFSDRSYTFYDMPYWLAGKNYLFSGYAATSHTATVTKGGFVYMLTSKGGNISIVNSLVNDGWTNVTSTIPSDLNIFGDSTQKGAFLSSSYNGFALLKKLFKAGDTLTWGKWGIPVFSGEIVISDDIAMLEAVGKTTRAAKVEDGMRLFSDRTYYAINGIPTGLDGLTYSIDDISTGATVKAVTAGTAYLMIPTNTNVYKTLETNVTEAGWKPVPTRVSRLATGMLFANRLYYKHVEVGEEIHFEKYNLVFGATLSDESQYYVMPSVSTAADVITNPKGDNYETANQNWLGCPTIEKTANGRIWAGWFTGGEKELGTGNYAIIKYSDNDCGTWKTAVAVVHPDTAVQVTKPELWTTPDGSLWLFWIQHTGTGNFDGRMGTWVSVCENPDAKNPVWSTPRRLTDGYMRSKPIVIDVDGVTTYMYAAFDWMQPHYTCVYASTDDGLTWSLRGKAECLDTSSGQNNLDDPVLVRKPDGTLWLLMRPSNGNRVYESFSYDGGYTWTHAKASFIEGPQSRMTVDVTSDGKMLMVFHDATTRSWLTAYLSTDGGDTWSDKLLLDERSGVSYPDTIITPDGTIYVIYDRNRTTDREVYIAKFTFNDILEGSFVGGSSRKKILVDKG